MKNLQEHDPNKNLTGISLPGEDQKSAAPEETPSDNSKVMEKAREDTFLDDPIEEEEEADAAAQQPYRETGNLPEYDPREDLTVISIAEEEDLEAVPEETISDVSEAVGEAQDGAAIPGTFLDDPIEEEEETDAAAQQPDGETENLPEYNPEEDLTVISITEEEDLEAAGDVQEDTFLDDPIEEEEKKRGPKENLTASSSSEEETRESVVPEKTPADDRKAQEDTFLDDPIEEEEKKPGPNEDLTGFSLPGQENIGTAVPEETLADDSEVVGEAQDGTAIPGTFLDDPMEEEKQAERADAASHKEEAGFLDDEDDFLDDGLPEETGSLEKEKKEEAGFLDDEDDFLDDEPFPEDAAFQTAARQEEPSEGGMPEGIVIEQAGESGDEEKNAAPEENRDGEAEKEETAKTSRKKTTILRLAAAAAAAAAAGAVFYGVSASRAKERRTEVLASYASVGGNLVSRDTPGLATAANIAEERVRQKQEEDEKAQEEAEKAELAEAEGSIPVSMSGSSIVLDLKIKIKDSSTGALIGGVPFQAQVTFPDGTTEIWEDDDQDGILYHTLTSGGTYTVQLLPLYEEKEGEDLADNEDYRKYGKYDLPEEAQSFEVRDEIAYEQVDVTDEILTEDQVNVAAEDTAQNTTKVESTVQDTVEWTESTKTEVTVEDGTASEAATEAATEAQTAATEAETASAEEQAAQTEQEQKEAADKELAENYDEVSKSDIPDPYATALQNQTDPLSESLTEALVSADIAVVDESQTASTESAEPASVRYVLFDTNSITASLGDPDVQIGVTVKWTDGTVNQDCTWSTSDSSVATVTDGLVHFAGAGTCTIRADAGTHYEVCTVTVKSGEDAASGGTVVIEGESTVTVNSTVQLSASLSSGASAQYSWKSNNTSIASVDENGLVTGIAPGRAQILCTAEADGQEYTGSFTVEVSVDSSKPAEVVVSPVSLSLTTGSSKKITAKVENTEDTGVVFASSDTSVAEVDADGLVTAVGTGSCTVTASSAADSSVKTEIPVTVTEQVTDDSPLLDSDGNQIYVRDGNTIREATAADYAVYSTFYRKKTAKTSTETVYRYTGWQTIGGLTYYYDKNGNKVTGDQVIGGTSYHFTSDGVLDTQDSGICIDVSTWNGSIDWSKVRSSGVTYAIIRCGYRGSSKGALVEDSSFAANMSGAAAAGIRTGVYFYSQATTEAEAVEEASMVLDLVSGYSLSLPIFIDVEQSGGRGDAIDAETRTKCVQAFCRTIENSGYSAGVYANTNWLTEKMNASALTGYHIWMAQYAASPTYSATRYDIWQYTKTGRVSGIDGSVDMSRVYRTY